MHGGRVVYGSGVEIIAAETPFLADKATRTAGSNPVRASLIY